MRAEERTVDEAGEESLGGEILVVLLEVGLSWLGELDGSKLEAVSSQLQLTAVRQAAGS